MTSSFSAAPAAPVRKNASKSPLNNDFTRKFHHKDRKDTKKDLIKMPGRYLNLNVRVANWKVLDSDKDEVKRNKTRNCVAPEQRNSVAAERRTLELCR